MTGQLVIVTGTTGSGKTTTCTEFVARADDLWLHFGVDIFLSKLTPKKFIDGGPRCHEGVHMVADDPADPDGPAHLVLGKYGSGLIHAMHTMAAAGVRSGQRIIMDHITTMTPPLAHDCARVLKDLPVLFVALKPPLDILEQRIEDRVEGIIASLGPEHGRRVNDNTKRVSAYMAREVYSHDCFDLVLDTGTLTPPEVVDAIQQRLAQGPGDGLQRLARQLNL